MRMTSSEEPLAERRLDAALRAPMLLLPMSLHFLLQLPSLQLQLLSLEKLHLLLVVS